MGHLEGAQSHPKSPYNLQTAPSSTLKPWPSPLHIPCFLSTWTLVGKQTFCPSSISEIHIPHTLTSLCHNWGKRKQNKANKNKNKKKKNENQPTMNRKQMTIFKRQFSKPQKQTQREIAIFSSTFTFLSHCSERPS